MNAADTRDIDYHIAHVARYVVFHERGRMTASSASTVTIDPTDVDYRSAIPVVAFNEQEAVGVAMEFLHGLRDNMAHISIGSCDYVGREDVIAVFRQCKPDVSTGKSDDKFQLLVNRWYAAELIGDEFGADKTSYSPIKVNGIAPKGNGRSELTLDFYHANYPSGVNSKRYVLSVLIRAHSFLLARSLEHKPTRLLQIYEISESWLKRHFDIDAQNADGIDRWLDQRM